ncbi:flagellar hook-length control protein FliK [Providencia rustigianii]|uniref:flagellar hook-length control protein FliK n=1 Tax=Providencia rustigianii TaxID=158850 RepID=UPI000F7016E8|nr:flagellar hook-length control protein FliK [Providencia rustigianii]MTC60338.1 flagellar hook-length control protein FliK [Providencia rustigianii]VEH54986.1 Flagellar hook-length control protein [Providencia rustigianii]
MDVNANLLPVTPTNSTKTANEPQRDNQIDETQAPAVPFQAILENQQPPAKSTENDAPLKTATDEATLNQQISEQKQAEITEPTPDKPVIGNEKAEQALAQLNFSRDLRGDSAQTPLQPELLTGKLTDEKALVDQLKQITNERIQTAANPQAAPEKPSTTPFTQSLQQLSDVARNAAPFDEKALVGSQLQLAGEEQDPTLGLMTKKEVGERRDQSLFALDNQRVIPTKDFAQDFMPLSKKSLNTDSISQWVNTNTENSQNLQNNAKGAFALQAETGAFTTSANSATPHVAGIMPTQATAQAATISAPLATPTMHLPSPLGSEAWQQQLSQHMLFFSRQGVSQAQIRLHPEELGSLNVHLRIEDNQAVMHFVSPHSHVRAAMESMMPILRNALQESGIHLAQGSVGQENTSSQSGAEQQPNQRDGQLHSTHPSVGVVGISEANASTSHTKLPTRQGGINTFA